MCTSVLSRMAFAFLAALAFNVPAHSRACGDWLKDALYGVNFVFQYEFIVPGAGKTPAGWNNIVDDFDVNTFASHIAQTGADWVLFHIGSERSGYNSSPNEAYDTYAGLEPGERNSLSDLPMDVAGALAPYGIKMMLYYNVRGPIDDAAVRDALNRNGSQGRIAVLREWSERYGEKCWGWWFDSWTDHQGRTDWDSLAAAAKSGNPLSMVAFNPGVGDGTWKSFTTLQDYTAGECPDCIRATGSGGCTPVTCPPRDLQGNPVEMQWHAATYLGSKWGTQSPLRFTDRTVIDYVKLVNSQGGVVLLDPAFYPGGELYEPHLAQLVALREAVKGTQAVARGPSAMPPRKTCAVRLLVLPASGHRRKTALPPPGEAEGLYDISGRFLSSQRVLPDSPAAGPGVFICQTSSP